MGDIRVRFACGHPVRELAAGDDMTDIDCPMCGERRVQHVEAPAPCFTAHGCKQAQMGPLVSHAPSEAI